MDPVLWKRTGELVEEALADEAIGSRSVPDLPLAELPIVEAQNMEGLTLGLSLVRLGQRDCGVTKSGVLSGVYVRRMWGDPGGLPDSQRSQMPAREWRSEESA